MTKTPAYYDPKCSILNSHLVTPLKTLQVQNTLAYHAEVSITTQMF
jgi:hypothetical protein